MPPVGAGALASVRAEMRRSVSPAPAGSLVKTSADVAEMAATTMKARPKSR